MPMSTGNMEFSAYEIWAKEEAVPFYRGDHVPSLRKLELGPWARIGGMGAIVNLADQEDSDAHVEQIAPGGSLNPERHMYEELIYVLSGRGATTVWLPGKQDGKQSFEWQRGSVFSPPLNSWHQHFNADGSEPARLVCVTSAPTICNLFHSEDFIFNNDYVFTDRYNGQDDYFSNAGFSLSARNWRTNFVPDVRTFKLVLWKERGAGGSTINFSIAGNSMCAHISQFPVGTYKKAHAHSAGAHVIVLSGTGYSLLWEPGTERRKVDWEEGSLLVPGNMQFHQHFNSGTEPARYLALRFNSPEFPRSGSWVRNYGDEGCQIEYEDEDPAIYELFESELAKVGQEVLLPRPEYRRK